MLLTYILVVINVFFSFLVDLIYFSFLVDLHVIIHF